MTSCIAPGWGIGAWGQYPWAGPPTGTPGGPIPTYPPDYDIYCVGPCGQMQYFTTYDEVLENALGGQIYVDMVSLDTVMRSDGTTLIAPGVTYTALIHVDVGVPEQWTFEFTAKFEELPVDFGDVEGSHIYFGSVDHTGASAGLFFSKTGVAYTGSVYHDLANVLHLNTVFQVLPGSAGLIFEGIYYSVRITVDSTNGTTFVYITQTDQLPVTGHVLRYVLPAIPSSSGVMPISDGSYISVRGTTSNGSRVSLDSVCMGSGLIIPNLPPVANAGPDQSVRACSIVRLDGTSSFDPEGANLTYAWRLIDGPSASRYVFEANDGVTLPPPPVDYTNKLYSESLRVYHEAADTEVVSGDVITATEGSFTVTGVGYDPNFYVTVDEFSLAVSTTARTFKLLKQNSISGPSTAKPTFYPDVNGLYKFELKVYDGALWSLPSAVIVNVINEVVPRGCIPNVGFLWEYISNFWKLVENKEHLETFWGSVAQITATEMLTLWQTEYNKSLRDIQRAFQRRWLHYDLRIVDRNIDLSVVETTTGGVSSFLLPPVGLVLGGKTVVFSGPTFNSFEVMFQGLAPLTPAEIALRLQQIIDAYVKDDDPTRRIRVDVLTSSSGDSVIRLWSNVPFSITGTATALFSMPSSNGLITGSGGLRIGDNTYLVDRSLVDLDIAEDDLLVLDGEGYRIEKVVDRFGLDDWSHQRLVLKDALPSSASSDWVIGRGSQSAFLDLYNAMLTTGDIVNFEIEDVRTGQLTAVAEEVIGASAQVVDRVVHTLTNVFQYMALSSSYKVKLKSVHRKKYMPLDDLVLSVPHLRERINNSNDEEVLRENIDYFIEEYRGSKCLRFVTGTDPDPDVWQYGVPPYRLWAETTFIDNRPVIEANFGIPAEFTLDDLEALQSNVDYLSAVRGIWYAHFHGPTLKNLRIGTQILLGLPFAEKAGTIEEIRNDFSTVQGRILIRDAEDTEIVRFYTYPKVLPLEINPATGEEYKEGDAVEEFAPLISGVEVTDYVKDPEWFAGYLAQGVFYEIEKFFKFLVRVNSAAFSLSSLMFVRNFILRIKPTYTFPVFVVFLDVSDGGDPIDVQDVVELSGTLYLQDDICPLGLGVAMKFDDWHPAGGGWTTSFDSGEPVSGTPPTYPNAYTPVYWGYDKSYLCPNDFAWAVTCKTFLGGEMPCFDDIFSWDSSYLYEDFQGVMEFPQTTYIPEVGHVLYPLASSEITVSSALTVTGIGYEFQMTGPLAGPIAVEFWAEVNGVPEPNSVITVPAWSISEYEKGFYTYPSSWNVNPGDVVQFFMKSTDPTGHTVSWLKSVIFLGTPYAWAYDTPMPAGTFCAVRML